MVVCRYFQQGVCRFGGNCRFEHTLTSKYTYQAPVVSSDQLIKQVCTEVDCAINGRQWILSCYAPFNSKPNFPGLVDYSFEEVRLLMYEAKTSGTLNLSVASFNQIHQSYLEAYKALSESPETMRVHFETLYKGKVPNSPFHISPPEWKNNNSVIPTDMPAEFSIFAQNSNTASPSIFGNGSLSSGAPQTNIFGGSSVSPSDLFASASNKLFGTTHTGNVGDIFASANSQHIFAVADQGHQGHNHAQSIFQQAVAANVFAGDVFAKSNFSTGMDSSNGPFRSMTNSNPFENIPFNSINASSSSFQSGNEKLFGSSPFQHNSAVSKPPVSHDASVYSIEDMLSEDVINAYKADSFVIGSLPEVAPTYSLCFS